VASGRSVLALLDSQGAKRGRFAYFNGTRESRFSLPSAVALVAGLALLLGSELICGAQQSAGAPPTSVGRTETVLNNAHELGIDLSNVEDVVLSHNHWDHVTGLVTLRRELSKINPAALSRAHVGQGIFLERLIPPGVRGSDKMTMAEVKKGYEALGGKLIEYVEPNNSLPGCG
jgi:hypothetical protein